jgi:hypothetical protein
MSPISGVSRLVQQKCLDDFKLVWLAHDGVKAATFADLPADRPASCNTGAAGAILFDGSL